MLRRADSLSSSHSGPSTRFQELAAPSANWNTALLPGMASCPVSSQTKPYIHNFLVFSFSVLSLVWQVGPFGVFHLDFSTFAHYSKCPKSMLLSYWPPRSLPDHRLIWSFSCAVLGFFFLPFFSNDHMAVKKKKNYQYNQDGRTGSKDTFKQAEKH